MSYPAQQNDFSDEFEEQLKRFNKIKIFIAIWLIALIDIPVLMYFLDFEKNEIFLIVLFVIVPIVPFVILFMKKLRCPHCNTYVGNHTFYYCAHCGVQIRKMTHGNNTQ
ncbi:MAG: hypothetical protein A2176_12885 [Spirochaetes bacterium RBG_13_51_14]|nr:MAG: hypothetical protein A2176_12885 [Spirochaetes bacterium RBG_13_51_14]